ncbi:MAG: arsenate reductase ArsC [Nitrospirae bacterium]|nr:arsenate reductase ArsC [Nitrospirota bacterium]
MMARPGKVLFVCIHNSARSQMAEAFLNCLSDGAFEASSAGLEPGTLNPVVVEAMSEAGIDISRNRTKGVSEFINNGIGFDYVITVCDDASAERCPFFPGGGKRIHWSFPDPSALTGPHEKMLMAVRAIRDDIREAIMRFIRDESDA